jgi:choline dehydrogenase
MRGREGARRGKTVETYDYIVIGAGSAGCAVAARLSEDPRNRVLLLEAGGRDRNPWIHIPVGYYRTMLDPVLSWGYATEPDEKVAGRSILWPRGRVLGGSSAINGLIYMRGQKEDYDLWRQMGNPGWAYEDVLPYFRRSEDQARGADAFHGVGGPLEVSDIPDRRPICEAFIAAALETGIPRNDDFNGARQEGVGYFQTTSRRGFRSSAATAYLKPARGRKNLNVVTGALTRRVLVAEGRATGVEWERGGAVASARCRGEVVVSGGAVNSPQLLQLSGIGPGEHLRALGIEVVRALEGVGRDLQDHYQVRALYEIEGARSLNTDVHNPLRKAMIGLQYALFRSGPLTISAGQVGLFARTRPELATPDIQFHFIPFSADKPGQSLHRFPAVTASICQLRPESRGEIMIRSADPREHPAIRPNYLDTETDRRTIVAGMKLNRRISRAPAFAKYLKLEREPGEDRQSDDELLRFARERGNTIFHPAGTCRMGPDERAVVDARLRVKGLAGLRVADCSIMPTVVSGNTNAPAIMIGEKCADLILEDARRR